MKCYNCNKRLSWLWFLIIRAISNRLCGKCDFEFWKEIKENGNLEKIGIYQFNNEKA